MDRRPVLKKTENSICMLFYVFLSSWNFLKWWFNLLRLPWLMMTFQTLRFGQNWTKVVFVVVSTRYWSVWCMHHVEFKSMKNKVSHKCECSTEQSLLSKSFYSAVIIYNSPSCDLCCLHQAASMVNTKEIPPEAILLGVYLELQNGQIFSRHSLTYST